MRGPPDGTSVVAAHAALVAAIAVRTEPFAAFTTPKLAPFLCAPVDASTLSRWLNCAERAEAAGSSVPDALAVAPGRGRTRVLLHKPLRRTVKRLAGLKRCPVRDRVAKVQDGARARLRRWRRGLADVAQGAARDGRPWAAVPHRGRPGQPDG